MKKQSLSQEDKEKIEEEIDFKIREHMRHSIAHEFTSGIVLLALILSLFILAIYNTTYINEAKITPSIECDGQTKFCPTPLACVSGYCVVDTFTLKDDSNWECIKWENRTEAVNAEEWCFYDLCGFYRTGSYACVLYESDMDNCLKQDLDNDGYMAINKTHCIKEMKVRDV